MQTIQHRRGELLGDALQDPARGRVRDAFCVLWKWKIKDDRADWSGALMAGFAQGRKPLAVAGFPGEAPIAGHQRTALIRSCLWR
jgi:hypothetical protein